MLIERIGAVSGYNSHKEIDFGSKLALPALLADFRIKDKIGGKTALVSMKKPILCLEKQHWQHRL